MRCIYRGAMGLFLSVRVCVFCLSISNQYYYYYYYKTHGHSEKLWNFFKANQQHSGTAVFIHHHFFSIPHLLQCVCCFLMVVLLYVVCQYSAVPNWRPYQDILTEIVQFQSIFLDLKHCWNGTILRNLPSCVRVNILTSQVESLL